jgi:hypothetical protein
MPFTPATTDKFTKVGTPGTATTLAAPGYVIGNASINVGSTTNWPTDTLVRFGIDVATIVNGLEVRTAGTYNEFSGIVTSATAIGSLTREYGTAQNYNASSLTRIYIPVAATRENALIDGLGQDHNLKGNHKTLTDDNGNNWFGRSQVASAVNYLQADNAITGVAPALEAVGADPNIPLNMKSKGTSLVQVNGVEIDPANSFFNAIINAGCMVAQRAAPTLSTAYQYGAVDRFAVKGSGTLVSAGTGSQTTTPNVTANGYALKLAGVTITGTGIVYVRYRMEARDALRFKNLATSFSVKIYQDTGGAINATVFINKATVVDNFTATSAIANSGAISVPNTTATTVKFENINAGNIGDVTNGIEIEIQLACGAVTTKNFEFAEFQFNKGAKALPFQQRVIADELSACQRYYEKSYDLGTPTGTATGVGEVTLPSNTNTAGVETTATVGFAARKRATPAIGFWDGSGNTSRFNTNISVTGGGFSATTSCLQVDALAPGITRYIFHWAVDAEL